MSNPVYSPFSSNSIGRYGASVQTVRVPGVIRFRSAAMAVVVVSIAVVVVAAAVVVVPPVSLPPPHALAIRANAKARTSK